MFLSRRHLGQSQSNVQSDKTKKGIIKKNIAKYN